jgi:hypothetical protein
VSMAQFSCIGSPYAIFRRGRRAPALLTDKNKVPAVTRPYHRIEISKRLDIKIKDCPEKETTKTLPTPLSLEMSLW